ncbi:lipase family protein [Sorangium sp. So ce296]|uniref:lipase family protein n=1 Tax=Sorangium sp. So ce296 TaxID=3133296 RepID=UPI003F625EDB
MTKRSRDDAGAKKDGPAATSFPAGAELDHVDKVDDMIQAETGSYDRYLAFALSAASSWSYSDADTMAKVMHLRAGIPWNETVALTESNPALLTETTAYLVQSEDRRLCILCFRGTGPLNIINWLSNGSSRVAPFLSAGHVHGGFLRSAMAMATTLGILLDSARKGGSICEAAAREKAMWADCAREHPRRSEEDRRRAGATPDTPRWVARPPRRDGPDVLEALYLTGHSLGGALAVITAALILEAPWLARFRSKLRGVYTYGQPLIGLQDFKDRFERELGPMLFRHVYRNDVVPSLPARTMGRFVHFGALYTSEGGEWMPGRAATRQGLTLLGTAGRAVLAGAQQEMLVDLPILDRIPLRFSIADHAPLNYLRASQMVDAGTEFV